MRTQDFDYDLPQGLIAQHPIEPRDSSRLLIYDRKEKTTGHKNFYDVLELLNKGDVLVLNNTKVLPARLFGVKRGKTLHVEFLLLSRLSVTNWDVIMKPGRKLWPGDVVDFAPILSAHIVQKKEDGVVEVSFLFSGIFEEILDELGQMPLPPYITEQLDDKTRYQTVYAKIDGSAAAPTAGLHFTPDLLEKIEKKGIKIVYILLHVGLGTFRPVKADDIEGHVMHSEYFSVSPEAAKEINNAKATGGRVIAVGTTSVRTLESASENGMILPQSRNTNIFIYPGYKFTMVDVLITNFHLPKSTLIMLVSAFCGREETLAVYHTAVEEKYRFFSFGDAMIIL